MDCDQGHRWSLPHGHSQGLLYVHTHTHAHTHTSMYRSRHTHTNMHRSTHTHTHTHTHTLTRTQIHTLGRKPSNVMLVLKNLTTNHRQPCQGWVVTHLCLDYVLCSLLKKKLLAILTMEEFRLKLCMQILQSSSSVIRH